MKYFECAFVNDVGIIISVKQLGKNLEWGPNKQRLNINEEKTKENVIGIWK